jgi:dTDP-4-amino-4,6-dideoxygalactose transaminase
MPAKRLIQRRKKPLSQRASKVAKRGSARAPNARRAQSKKAPQRADSVQPIPQLDLAAQHAPLSAQLRAAFERVLASNTFIMGGEVSAFEAEVATYIGVEHAIGVSSGTDAVLLALMALGVGPGDEVIVPPFSFFATAGCVARVGARPVFVDIDPDTFNLSVPAVAAKLSPATKAIMPVHLYGQTCDLEALTQLAAERGIPLVEDAAQALGAQSERLHAGAAGAFGCFSFFPSKNLGALGDAGLLTTRDATLARRARLLRAHGAEPKYHHALIGGNFRLDALQAAFLRAKLPQLPRWMRARQAHAAHYDRLFRAANLPGALLTPPARRYAGHVYNQYVIRCAHRDALLQHLRAQGIGCEIYYPVPLHLQVCFAHLGEAAGRYPHAEQAAREVLALPMYPELSAEQVERVAAAVIAFLQVQAA